MTTTLRELAREWRAQQSKYPQHGEGQAAAAAVRLCANELDDLTDALEAQHSQDNESRFECDNKGDIRSAKRWGMGDWIRAHILGAKKGAEHA